VVRHRKVADHTVDFAGQVSVPTLRMCHVRLCMS
jgi:hypothetical protein